MQLTRCRKGHFYDASLTSECPECALLYLDATLHYGLEENSSFYPSWDAPFRWFAQAPLGPITS